MTDAGSIYEFVFRAQMADQALDVAGRSKPRLPFLDEDVANAIPLDLLDDHFVAQARRMATVYTAIAAFENSVRDLVRRVMLEAHGANWWATMVSAKSQAKAKTRQEDEEKHRFHTQRGDDPVRFIDFGDLLNVMRSNDDLFAPFWPSPEWAKGIFDAVERSRNVIMHSGLLDMEDIERVGINIRDWVRQVGA
ncbi:MAG TPA: Swt1 family HEPN domain-containing protein [Solirubrobacteraceae bacterium]|nr:Swt1 family HEPN domain-containing protein [Solirubrobacteraceae bacterium]